MAQPTAAASVSHAPRTPIEHFIVLMQEDHTFDNYFGTYPGADGIPAQTKVPVDPGSATTGYMTPFHLGDSPTADLDHTGRAASVAFDHGRMDGFVAAQREAPSGVFGALAMGYYDRRDVPYYWNVADHYVLFDRFFTSALSGGWLNHVYWVAGGPGSAKQFASRDGLRATTIFDRLQQAGVSWKFYVQDYDRKLTYRTSPSSSQVVWCPLLDIARFLDDPSLSAHIVDLGQYYRDLHRGTLPQVAYVVPSEASEHPPASLMKGQQFASSLVNALIGSSSWHSSAFMISYDDWGGWYDHVRPPRRDQNGDGFRAPTLLVSPYARHHFVDHTTLDFTSMLKFIEQNWNLVPLTRLDATAGSIMGAFDFGQTPRPSEAIPLGVRSSESAGGRGMVLYVAYGVGAVMAIGMLVGVALWPRRRRPASTVGDSR